MFPYMLLFTAIYCCTNIWEFLLILGSWLKADDGIHRAR